MNATKLENLDRLRALAETGVDVPILRNLPSIPPHLMWLWNGWQALASRRLHTESGPQPIQISEILAYTQFAHIPSSSDRDDFLHIISVLDRRWLDEAAKRRDAAQKKAQRDASAKPRPPSRPPRRR